MLLPPHSKPFPLLPQRKTAGPAPRSPLPCSPGHLAGVAGRLRASVARWGLPGAAAGRRAQGGPAAGRGRSGSPAGLRGAGRGPRRVRLGAAGRGCAPLRPAPPSRAGPLAARPLSPPPAPRERGARAARAARRAPRPGLGRRPPRGFSLSGRGGRRSGRCIVRGAPGRPVGGPRQRPRRAPSGGGGLGGADAR